jgi:hypothetical protein
MIHENSISSGFLGLCFGVQFWSVKTLLLVLSFRSFKDVHERSRTFKDVKERSRSLVFTDGIELLY